MRIKPIVFVCGLLSLSLLLYGCGGHVTDYNNRGTVYNRTYNQNTPSENPLTNEGNTQTINPSNQIRTPASQRNPNQLNWGPDYNLGILPREQAANDRNNPTKVRKQQSENPYALLQANRDDLDTLKASPYSIDRNQLAQVVAQNISSIPNLHDVAILVTDDQVYVGYNDRIANRTNDKNNVMDQQIEAAVKGIIPSFYKIHVSNDENLTNQILKLANSRPENFKKDLNQLLDSQKTSPK